MYALYTIIDMIYKKREYIVYQIPNSYVIKF